MGDSDSSVDSSGEGSSVSEKGRRNKRKLLSDMPPAFSADESTLSLTEFPRYEILEEKFQKALHELGSMLERRYEDPIEEQQEEEYQQTDWDDPIACSLEEILTNNLYSIFYSAVKKIVECGYTEEAAERAVLNSSRSHGSGKDAVSNVVDSALSLLKREKVFNLPKHPVFDGLQSLVDYTLLEMINVVQEVRPGLTVAEAMWYLLISDLNLLNACEPERGPSDGSSGQIASGESSTLPLSKSETSGTSQSDSNKLDTPRRIASCVQSSQPEKPVAGHAHQLQNYKPSPGELASSGKESSSVLQEAKGKFSGIGREHIHTSSQGKVVEEKPGGSRIGSSASSKRDVLRQKPLHTEKNLRGRLSKGAFKAKVTAWGNMVLDKSLKLQSGSSNMTMKGNFSKSTSSAGTNGCLEEGHNHPSSNSQSGPPASASSVKDSLSTLPAVNAKSPGSSVPDINLSPKGKIDVTEPPKTTDYYASIPFDETLKKHIPQDNKDETILKLVPHKQALEKELQGWTDWANKKVMQAARRLGKDQGELKMLRQEKEETEKLKKDKQTLEESTTKRLSEMEHALSSTTGQIEVANASVHRLQEENSGLKDELEAAKMQALKSATNLQKAILREQEGQKKLQSWEAEKGLVMEQLTHLKHQIAELISRLEKAKERQNQFKVLFKQEEKEKLKVATQIDNLRGRKEEEAALMKVEANNIKQTAEKNMQKCEEDIKNLENMISELRLESDKAKIAALNVGYGTGLAGKNIPSSLGVQLTNISKSLANFQDNNYGAGDVKPERECVMCMADEISIVFLPCAHQVLCSQCSVLHEKEGMNDCPSCRALIQKRISVGYRAD